MAKVSLRDVAEDNVSRVARLELPVGQEAFVAPTAVTIAEAQFDDSAIVKVIYADDEPVGLVALARDEDGLWLWRLFVAGDHQRKGYGRETLTHVFEMAREQGETDLLTSYVPGDGSPAEFYLRNGFTDTGRMEHGERVLKIAL